MFKYIARVFARQIVRRIAVVIVGALFMLVPALWGGLQAHAASIYDDAWHTTDTLELGINGCETQDITLDFYSQTIENAGNNTRDWQQALNNAISNDGRWITSIDKRDFSSVNQNVFYIYWTEDASLELIWETSGHVRVSGNDIYGIQMMMAENCNLYSYYLNPSPTNYVSSKRGFSQEFTASYFHIDEEKLNKPVGYEGNPVESPQRPQPPVTGEQYTPDWVVLSATDWNAEIRDKRFFTFDGIFWTCSIDGSSLVDDDSGITPGIEWELWNDENVMIDSGTIGAAAMWTYQFPKHEVEREYVLKGRYFCGNDENVTPIYFGDTGVKSFTITATGVLEEQDFFADCFTAEFPFINMNACVHNLAAVVNALSFGVIKVNGFESTDSCRQLQTVGDWINKPGETICPQFPSYVRSTVTPFVMFILGIFTAIFIVSYLNKRGIN